MESFITYRNLKILLLMAILVMKGLINPVTGQVLPGQLDYPHNHLPWFTLEGDHFMIHYQDGNSRSALLTLSIAEAIYHPVTELYRFEPDRKTNIILRDREDYSNGAAYYFDNKIEIWLPSIDTPFRGTHHWLKNVITHEFTHMVQLGASMRRSGSVPSIYLQWMGYEDVRRPDILYGFPNSIVTFPFAAVSIPAWFAEGTAQYQVSSLAHDSWDSHRDMMLRTRILADQVLSLDQMNHFSSKNSLERELVYNQGFDFVRYLAEKFGEEVLADLTHVSATTGRNNFNHVLESVTGEEADQLFSGWLYDRKMKYRVQLNQLPESEYELISETGFLNFYPQIDSVNGTFAYISNKNRDHSRTALIIQQPGESEYILDDHFLSSDRSEVSHNCHFKYLTHAETSLNHISNRFSFSPDGSQIAYSRAKVNRYGERYQDLYIYTLNTDSRQQISNSARIQDPAWHPSDDIIAAVRLQDGTQNLIILDLNSYEITQLTSFQSNETINTPVWSAEGETIYFAISSGDKRDIARTDLRSGVTELILSSPDVDFRDPYIHQNGKELFFSSDIHGIFNLYSLNLITSKIHRYTDLTGGAFMPYVSGNSLYFSLFQWDGYKIAALKQYQNFKRPVSDSDHDRFLHHSKNSPKQVYEPDPLLAAIEPFFIQDSDQSEPITFESNGITVNRREYSETATGLTIYPVLRFDNYSKLRGRNSRLLTGGEFGRLGENLWRDLKFGAYFSIRDVTERLSFFWGALIGPGSVKPDKFNDIVSPARINNLDRDIFFMADYRGLPFIQRSWSPTISLEIYNMKRNVNDGLSIEEFACTSCLPTERSLDIRYSMWEANLYLRSKLNRWSLIELGAAYSPYTVTIDRFFSEEYQQLIPSTSTVYFKGTRFSASYITDLTIPDRHADIAPRGIRSSLSYQFEPGRLLQEFTVEDGVLSPAYTRDQNHSIELNNRFGFTIAGDYRALITSRYFAYLNRPDDYFYLDYSGGLARMRSYPYFALGGHQTFFTRASLLFPLLRNMNHQFSSATFDKIYGHLFFEIGNGRGGPLDIGNQIKSGVGSELRVAFNNYYFFPMKFFINTTYGLNRFDVTLPSQFITSGGSSQVEYGRELLFYIGLTFDFDL